MTIVLSVLLVVCLVVIAHLWSDNRHLNVVIDEWIDQHNKVCRERGVAENEVARLDDRLRLSKAECVGLSDQVAGLKDELQTATRERDKSLTLAEQIQSEYGQFKANLEQKLTAAKAEAEMRSQQIDRLVLEAERDHDELRRVQGETVTAQRALEELKQRVRDMAEIECPPPVCPTSFREMAIKNAIAALPAAAKEPPCPDAPAP